MNQRTGQNHNQTNLHEIWTFLGIRLLFSTTRKMNQIFEDFLAEVNKKRMLMSVRRFQILSKNLCFSHDTPDNKRYQKVILIESTFNQKSDQI